MHFAPELFWSCLSSSPEKFVQELLSVTQNCGSYSQGSSWDPLLLAKEWGITEYQLQWFRNISCQPACFLAGSAYLHLYFEYGILRYIETLWLCWCWAVDLQWDKHQIHIWCLFSWNHGQHKHAPHATALLLRNTLKFQIPFLFILPAPVWMTAVLLPTEMSADPVACFPLKCLFLGKYYIWGSLPVAFLPGVCTTGQCPAGR